MRFLTVFLPGVACLMGSPHIKAFEIGVAYDTELQTDFRGAYNWVNLLILDGRWSVSDAFAIEAATISIARTEAKPIVDDLQGFSNIEEDPLALGIARLGAEYRYRRSVFFLGIRNVNEDYFTSPVTSLFVNSSCGIFPTISSNYDIANYPLSSWCFHYKAAWDNLTVQTSLYDGLGHRRIAGHDNIFRFSPRHDGIFSITSLEYDKNGSNYSVGCAVYYGVYPRDEISIQEATPPGVPSPTSSTSSHSLSVAPWLNLEHRLGQRCSAMLQASCSTSDLNCRYYFGLGAIYEMSDATLGIFADYADYRHTHEFVTELTCDVALTDVMSLQPAVEFILTGSQASTLGLLRLKIRI